MAISQTATGRDSGFTLDETVLKERRVVSARRVHAVQIPAFRAMGFVILCLLLAVQDVRLPGAFPSAELRWLVLLNLGYAALSWCLVYLAYGRTGRFDVGLLFLHLDVLIWLPTLHQLGQGNPYIAFFILVRVADQAGFGFRRALYFAHVLPLVYLVYVGFMEADPAPARMFGHLAAAAIMYVLGIYLAATASVSERLRDRTRQAVRTARELVGRLEHETRALEEQAVELEHARRAAEQASVAKSQFLATMSHEIRTPLNGVLGTTRLLLETPLSPLQQRYADAGHRSATSLLGLIDDVLDLSRIEAGKLEMNLALVDVRSLAREAVDLIGATAGDKPVQLRCDVAAAVPASLSVDPLRLRQVLVNLLHNAVKFTEQGEVALRVSVLDDTPAATRLRFEVSDTGIGIAPDQLDSVFGAFTQADASTSRQYGGSGLGLAIVRQLVQLMGGRIDATSQPGHGSVLAFELGLAKITAAAAGNAPPGVAARSLAGALVLLAEDEPVNQLVVTEMLRKLGCHVDVVCDGGAACDSVAQRPYDLVLMDCHMPGVDGYGATERIRQTERPGSRRTVIVALTADALVASRERCMASGMDDFLTKPLSFEALRRTLERWVERPIAAD